MDVTPLLSLRTGIGYSVEGMWRALGEIEGGPRRIPFALGRPGPASGELPAGIHLLRLPTRALVALWSRTDRPRIDRWIAGADVVHATNFVAPPTGLPLVMTIHDLGFVHEPSTANPVVATFPAMIRRALHRGAHVHVTTDQVALEVDDAFGPGLLAGGRITVIPFGVPDPVTDEGARPGPGSLTGGRPYVLALGSDEPRKNLPRLVDAFASVAPRLPDLALVIAGPSGAGAGGLDDALRRLPGELRARTVRTGPVSAAARTALLRDATALAYPSTYEGFGFPMLEAMAAGVPVFAGDIGALREVAGGAAALVDPEDVASIAAALERLVIDDAERDRLVAAGRARVGAFSWAATAAGLLQLYTSVTGRS
jgi:glycosyltransferase involved in cell wall biosynthesis